MMYRGRISLEAIRGFGCGEGGRFPCGSQGGGFDGGGDKGGGGKGSSGR